MGLSILGYDLTISIDKKVGVVPLSWMIWIVRTELLLKATQRKIYLILNGQLFIFVEIYTWIDVLFELFVAANSHVREAFWQANQFCPFMRQALNISGCFQKIWFRVIARTHLNNAQNRFRCRFGANSINLSHFNLIIILFDFLILNILICRWSLRLWWTWWLRRIGWYPCCRWPSYFVMNWIHQRYEYFRLVKFKFCDTAFDVIYSAAIAPFRRQLGFQRRPLPH